MKSILISIKPEWVAKILNGEKTIEIRKTAPKCALPIDVYIYCTKGLGLQKFGNKYFAQEGQHPVRNGKIVAKFTLLRADEFDMGKPYEEPTSRFLRKACVTLGQARTYANGKRRLYAWHISDLEIFDKPKELDGFGYPCPSGTRYIGQHSLNGLPSKKRPPESWCYVEVE